MKAGLRGSVAAKKPLLRKANKVKRLQWACKHANWTISQWKTVVWSDESKFELFGNKRRIFVGGTRMNVTFRSELCLLFSMEEVQ